MPGIYIITNRRTSNHSRLTNEIYVLPNVNRIMHFDLFLRAVVMIGH